jgi:SpoVK/Ycf46/Vps4 family AAA+-type ATPase
MTCGTDSHCLPVISCCWQVVAKTDGYSGSDMRNLIQEACQGPVRDAVARVGEAVATLSDADLRPVSGSRLVCSAAAVSRLYCMLLLVYGHTTAAACHVCGAITCGRSVLL